MFTREKSAWMMVSLNIIYNVREQVIMRPGANMLGKPLFIRVVNCTLVDTEKHKINPLVKLL